MRRKSALNSEHHICAPQSSSTSTLGSCVGELAAAEASTLEDSLAAVSAAGSALEVLIETIVSLPLSVHSVWMNAVAAGRACCKLVRCRLLECTCNHRYGNSASACVNFQLQLQHSHGYH